MKNGPYHVYWGKTNGVVVTRDAREEGGRPEVAFTSNSISLEKLRLAGIILFAGVILLWRISRLVKKAEKRRAARREQE